MSITFMILTPYSFLSIALHSISRDKSTVSRILLWLLLTELVGVFTGRVLFGTLAYVRGIATGTGTRFPRVPVEVFKGP